MDVMTDLQDETKTEKITQPGDGLPMTIMLWSLVIATVTCDLLSLCHLMPSHSQHLARPYILSMVKFKVFK